MTWHRYLRGYLIRFPRGDRYAQVLKPSAAFKDTANERPFVMMGLAAVEKGSGLGARVREGEIAWAR